MSQVRSITFTLLVLLLLSACGGSATQAPTPTPQPTAEPTQTPLPTPTQEPTPVPSPTATSLPAPAAKYQEPGDYVETLRVSGVERKFLIHVPPGYQPGEPAPLVVNMHGYSGTASGQERLSQMNAKADQEGFIAVHPQAQGSPPAWWGPVYGPTGQPDLIFFRGMLAYLQREMSIDPARIYATGMSNGAMMVNRLGCDMADTFAAIAPVSGGHVAPELCQPTEPVSVLVFHGTEDDVMPYDGDSEMPAVRAWVLAWAERDGCDPTPDSVRQSGTVAVETWKRCDGETGVQFYTVEGGRHDWPGSGFGPPPWPEGMKPDVYATDVIWEFFKAHPKSSQAVESAPGGTSGTASAERYQKAGDYIDSLWIDGAERWFTVHLPPGYQRDVELPLVLNLHAYTSTAFAQEMLTSMNSKADEEGFIAVHPQAMGDPPSWWGPLPGPAGQPDRDFFRELLAYLQRVLPVDPARVYATGLSNGGTMSHSLGCIMSDVFAAVAPVAGGHTAYDQCQIERPVSVLVIHGTDDPVIPYDGSGTDSAPVHVWLEAWAQRNGCSTTPETGHPYESVLQETWGDCAENVEVILYTLEGGGHVWPGGAPGMSLGGDFPHMNATDVIWEFFKAHSRPTDPSE